MLATSPSPNFAPQHLDSAGSGSCSFSPRLQHAHHSARAARSTLNQPQHDQTPTYYIPSDASFFTQHRSVSTKSLDRYTYTEPPRPRVKMVDAATQYSPPEPEINPPSNQTPTTTIAGLQLSEKDEQTSKSSAPALPPAQREPPQAPPPEPARSTQRPEPAPSQVQTKRQAVDPAVSSPPTTNGIEGDEGDLSHHSPVKKARPDAPPIRMMPALYETCNTRDLVVLISSMLMELIRYNDAIPLREGHLTRFHSRAPPGISVLDYLQRLTTHATLSPPILLSMVYYIDRLCALYPAFTISSLTVHRFLITSATVASKGLSDSFWTNKTYARVGGVSMKELALLELEFLTRMEWRIVPKPEVLCDYYKSLIERNSQYQLET